MADTGPSKSDIQAVFKRLRAINTNKVCFDCDAKNPTWASVTYGVFICIDCSATHRSLGVHVSFVRSTQLDTNWTWLQLRAMQVGGNASAFAFFTQHNCTTKDAQQKYNSRAAQLYKERLHHLASQAMRLHGTVINIDTHHDSTSPQQKDIDFFQEHAEAIDESADNMLTRPQPIKNGTLSHPGGDTVRDGPAPSVEAALSVSPTRAQAEPRKTTIGSRKAPQQKKGLGGKKGLGAQKVSTDFSQIEKEAQMADERKMTAVNEAAKAKTKEEEEEHIQSMRLAYRDISLEKQNQEDKLKQVDPKKAAQFERLGMGGFGSQKGFAHSATSDMKVIQQETPISEKQRYHGRSRRDYDDEDEWEFLGGFSSGPPKYNDSPFGSKNRYGLDDDPYGPKKDKWSSKSWEVERMEEKTDSIFDEPVPKSGYNNDDDSRLGRSRNKQIEPVTDTGEAQKKFGSAKAISSDQYFGDKGSEWHHKQNLARFEGSSSISSADYFGDGRPKQSQQRNFDYSNITPDISGLKEGVKDGVTKVAGRISNLANNVVSTIQDRYT